MTSQSDGQFGQFGGLVIFFGFRCVNIPKDKTPVKCHDIFYIVCRYRRYGQLKFGDFGQKMLNRLYRLLLSPQPLLSQLTTFVNNYFISTTLVNLTAFVNFCQLGATSFVTNINHVCRYGRGHYFCQTVRPLL